ncbi:MAG: Cof-type HAD-IIB family hydrolase [Treponema sp.]|jgi:Cof subfamily protein (haloacid dehalogenase superfamily)|nr:Cof-type HAD-IIB family hydrolase [Treponema sp.]
MATTPSSNCFSHIKALALDLDGTLLRPDNTMGELTVNTLKACRDRGLHLIVCTGRSPEASEKYRAAIGAAGPMVFFNGAEVTDVDAQGGRSNTVYTSLLRFDVIDFCVDIARKTGVYFQVYFPENDEKEGRIGKRLMADRGGAEWDMYAKHTGSPPVIADIQQTLAAAASRVAVQPEKSGCVKGMFLADPAKLNEIRPFLSKQFGDTVYITKTLDTFLEIMATGVSKGAGLTLALDRLSLTSENVLAFGDEESDLSMFNAAGFSAAPANAKDRVKAAARMVINANTEEGVARFLAQALLKP